MPIFFEDLGPLKTQSLFLSLHTVSDPKSVNSDSFGTEKINDVRHRRWSSVILVGEIESRDALPAALINKSRPTGMQSVWAES
jgi:hypothetical protein